MKLYEILKRLSRKSTLKFDRCVDLKQYYIGMYRNYMIALYDRGYILDPTVWDDRQFFGNIVDMDIKGLSDISGRIVLSEDFITYALDKNSDPEIQDFLSLLYNAVRYRTYSNTLDAFYEEFKKGTSLKLQMDGARVYSRSAAPINRGSLACLVDKDSKVKEYTLNEFVWNLAMKELGISSVEDGLFDKDLSHEQEVRHMSLLLEGKVQLSGTRGKLLEDWLFKHKWSADKLMRTEDQGLLGYIFITYADDISNYICSIVEQQGLDSVVAIQGLSVYVSEPIKQYKLPMGYFTILSDVDDTDILLDETNNLLGYTGEAYTLEYLEEEGIEYVGLPIKLYKDGILIYAYDREQTLVKSTTWFIESDIEFGYEDTDMLNPFKDTSIAYTLVDSYIKSRGKFYIGGAECSSKELSSSLSKALKKGVM